uniref:Uncharacterized protein n=1 Tax=Cannabis sativa TaxID=3483 RepID=A0A803QVI9_CANSA
MSRTPGGIIIKSNYNNNNATSLQVRLEAPPQNMVCSERRPSFLRRLDTIQEESATTTPSPPHQNPNNNRAFN